MSEHDDPAEALDQEARASDPGDDSAPTPPASESAESGAGRIDPPASPGSPGPDEADVAFEPLDDRLRPLDPKALTVDRIGSLIFTVVVTLVLLGVLTLDLVIGWWGWAVRLPVWAGVALMVLGMLWLSIVWTRLSHNATVFRVNEQGLEIRRGVLWRRVISVPRSRVQHTDVGQGPLQRRFGLATLTVHTAATRTPSVQLVGLARETAMRVRENLRQTGEDDGV